MAQFRILTNTQDVLQRSVATYDDFQKIEILVGTILRAEPFPEARKPSYKLWIDLGEGRTVRSSAQITKVYELEDLPGRQVLCVANLGSRRIAGFESEVLVCGFDRAAGEVVLAQPSSPVPNGSRLY